MWRNHQDHVVPACSKGVDLFDVFISTWFSLFVLNLWQNHRVLRSILWSFQVFERRRPPETNLEWIKHQMIKWSIFSRPKRTHISSSGQNESTSSPYFFWAKVAVENHRLKSGISQEENMLLRGDLVFLPTFVHHLNTGTLPEEHLPTSLWGYVSGRVDPNQLRCRKKQHQTNIYALQHCSISTLLWSFFLSKWQCFRNRWRSPSFSPKQTKMLHVLLACIIPHQWLARDMCCDHRGIAEARDVDRGCYMFTQQGQQIQHHHDLRGSNPLFNQGPYMPTRLLRQVKNFPNNTWKKASGQLDSTLPLLGQKANTWNPMLSQPR